MYLKPLRRPVLALTTGAVGPLLMTTALVATALAVLPTGATAVTGQEPPRLRLAAEAGSVVRSATTAVPPGTTRLRTSTFRMVGFVWSGDAPALTMRSQGTSGWSGWRRVRPMSHLPDGATGAVGAAEPIWTGPATALEVRLADGRDVEVVLIDPARLPADATEAPPVPQRTAGKEPDRAPRPELRRRRDWDADESWRSSEPRYNRTLKQVHVHHTATGNGYHRGDVAGLIRGMYHYHTHTLGWSDIGYNFLVDRFGRTWVGRAGGAWRKLRGAHTLGFNHNSTGVAVIGNYEGRGAGKRIVGAVSRLAAWKLDKQGREARGKVHVRSEGSDKYDAGDKVWLPAIDGHRDTNDTACPGGRLYEKLPAIRRRAQARIDRFS